MTDINVHFLPDHSQQLIRIEGLLTALIQDREKFMADFTRLIEKVTKIEDKGDAIIATLNGIAQELRDLKLADRGAQAAVDSIADRIDSQAEEFVTAVDANTTPPSP